MEVASTIDILSKAIAPVFLISAVALVVNGQTARYGRVIDRARTLLREGRKLYERDINDHVSVELRSLYRRAHILRTAIILASTSIFFVVIAIFLLFLGLMFEVSIPLAPEFSFVASLAILLISMALFIEDFAISLKSLKHDIYSRGDPSILEDSGRDKDNNKTDLIK